MWNITVTGTPDEIAEAMDASYEKSLDDIATTADERLHILDAIDFVKPAAESAALNVKGPIRVTAFSVYEGEKFTRLSVLIERAPVFAEPKIPLIGPDSINPCEVSQS